MGVLTEPNVAVLILLVVCDITAIPASKIPETLKTMLDRGIGVQVLPSFDV